MTSRRLVLFPIIFVFLLLGSLQTITADSTVYLPLLMVDYARGWQEVGAGSASGGGISASPGRSEKPAVAFSSDGVPYIAWADNSSGNYEIYVLRWDGSRWQEAGTGSASGGGISNTSVNSRWLSMAVGPNGSVYVAWEDWITDDHPAIYVKKWDGSSWLEVGSGSSSGDGISGGEYSRGPAIAVSRVGTPYIAWSELSDGVWNVFIRRFLGSTWQEVGAGSDSGDGISDLGSSAGAALALTDAGMPYVAWEFTSGDDQVFVRRYNGATWVEVPAGSASGTGISNTSGNSNGPGIGIGPDGVPHICWDDDSEGAEQIYVRRFGGATWEEIGAASASGGGISDSTGDSTTCALAMSPGNRPYVAWNDDSSGSYEIYVRSWDGLSWSEVGAGSATGGGVSNSGNASWRPAIAVSPTGVPYVAWYEFDDAGGNYEIYVRRYQ